MRAGLNSIWAGLAVLHLTVGAVPANAAPAPAAPSGTPAARVGGEVITLEEVERAVQPQLGELAKQRYEILGGKLEQLIGERLLAQEARRRNVSVEQLLKTEVYMKTPEIPDDDVTAFINQNRAQLAKMEDEELRLNVWDYLRHQKVSEQRKAYVRALRDQAKVAVLLEEPPGARVKIDGTRGFARGPNDAPVTIVEFSDFECPFCNNAAATIRQVLDKYPNQVRVVFRDYPVASLHPRASKAHEAARCAGDQGKFWEYHDLLFERAPRLSPEDLKQYAQDLRLDSAAFGQCVDTGKFAAEVEKDTQEAMSLGLTGTPNFFINGRQLAGAQPLEAFQKLIDAELAKRAADR